MSAYAYALLAVICVALKLIDCIFLNHEILPALVHMSDLYIWMSFPDLVNVSLEGDSKWCKCQASQLS